MSGEESITFENMDSWKGGGSKFGLTFKQIILQHINRCVINGSVEFHGGMWEEKVVGTSAGANIARRYVPNSRETYCNSIKVLRIILLGYYDDKMKEKEIMEKINGLETAKDITKEDYQDKKVEYHAKLFEELILLAKRLNFFEEESVEEDL